MSITRWAGAAALALASAAPLSAQTGECTGYPAGQARNICNAAVDGTRLLHPMLGMVVSGGNPVIGSGGALGGLGHFSVTVRANAVRTVTPDLSYAGESSTVPEGDEILLPAPLVEAAAGVWGGLPGGLLAVDLLGSAVLLPTDQIDGFSLDPDATTIGDLGLGLGFGARVGLLAERGPLPGVSVSVMRRTLPQIKFGEVDDGDEYSYAVDLKATNLRVVASKSLPLLTVAAGFGWDKYTGDAEIEFANPLTGGATTARETFELDQSRGTVFANAGFSLAVVKIVGELGYQLGKDQNLSTDFEGIDDEGGKMYGGLGLRVSF
jgi:hypothetical protein